MSEARKKGFYEPGVGLKSKYSSSEADQPRDLLRARTEKVVLDTNLNKVQVVQSAGLAAKQPGFHCKECDCVVKDSVNFLDHINGKKHQRALGMTMKVERSTLDQIKAKMAELKKKKEEGPEFILRSNDFDKILDFDAQIEKSQKQEEEEKRRRKERKKAKKKGESGKNNNSESGKNDINEEEISPEMEKLMGYYITTSLSAFLIQLQCIDHKNTTLYAINRFGSFGSTKSG
ncbi:3633_t:CDS:2 [Acaulospora colombiana]|uniref:3633_t:CDS:1 n=1 Tax=Acaulospora colombiana TaxID=27376 RepID=A0ACA9KSQ2_9GLOM|nr:3633_t:CDS:2 [Acaulospora colombiana]